jgi:hypothetical protein
MKKNMLIYLTILLLTSFFCIADEKNVKLQINDDSNTVNNFNFSFKRLQAETDNSATDSSGTTTANKIQKKPVDMNNLTLGLLSSGGTLVGIGLLILVPGIISIPVYYYILEHYYITAAGKEGLKNYLLTTGIICTAIGGALFIIGLPLLIAGSVLKAKNKKMSLFFNSFQDKTELGLEIKI